jgi:adenosylhomocysteine nucleosidase
MPAGAARAARWLISQGATSLVSFGLAGALDPALRPGDLVIPRTVLCAEKRFTVTPQWTPTCELLFAADHVLATAANKHAAWAATNASAVDLESGAVAQVAAEAGIGFSVLRAICDPAERDLPPAALLALDGAGRIGMLRVLASVAAQPQQIPALLRLAQDASAARRGLLAALSGIPASPKHDAG